MSQLDEVTKQFGDAYLIAKHAEEAKKSTQTAMFDAFTRHLSQRTLRQQTINIPDELVGEDLTSIETWITRHYPGWRFVAQFDIGSTRVIIEEDPKLVKFTHLNRDTGTIYGRTINQASPSLDDELLRTKDPALWERVTTWPEPWASLVVATVRSMVSTRWSDATVNAKVDELLREQNVQRTLRTDLSDDDWQALEPYLVPGAITVKLMTPRVAKPEELGEVNE